MKAPTKIKHKSNFLSIKQLNMLLLNLIEMINEEINNNRKISDGFLQKIRDIGLITEYAPQYMIGGSLPPVSEDGPKITEDLRKIKTVSDLYHAMERLKAFYDKHLPQDTGKYPIVMHTFIPKNRD